MSTAKFEGAAWVLMFSTSTRLTAFVATRDSQSDGEVPYVRTSSSRLLDGYVSNLREPAGIALDDHMLLAPTAQPTTSS